MVGLGEMSTLIETCAPGIAAETMLAIVEVESRFRPLAIGVNGRPRRALAPSNLQEAITTASELIASGASVDLGLAQVNSDNLQPLGLSVADAFDPCRNLAAAAVILREGYDRATSAGAEPQAALRAALSSYNTGHPRRGVTNGYVGKVISAADAYAEPVTEPQAADAAAPPTWDVFARGSATPTVSFVFSFRPGASQ